MEDQNPKVLVVMGSDSDFDVMKSCLKTLRKFGIALTAECVLPTGHRSRRQNWLRLHPRAVMRSSLRQQEKRHICPSTGCLYYCTGHRCADQI